MITLVDAFHGATEKETELSQSFIYDDDYGKEKVKVGGPVPRTRERHCHEMALAVSFFICPSWSAPFCFENGESYKTHR